MAEKTLIGIDIGTTSTKIILANLDGRILSSRSYPSQLHSPEPGQAEEDPLQWWENVCQGIPACLQDAGMDAGAIIAVGVSGMVPTTIPVNSVGQPLRRSIQQNDARAVREIAFFKANVNEEEVFQKTGSAVTQQSIGPKLLWLAENEPAVLQETRFIMGSYDFINYKLTGVPSLEQNWALESGLYDLHTRNWDENLLALAGIQRDQLPDVHAPAEIVGHVCARAAGETGLCEGTPVTAGSADHVASAFSVGLKENGDLLIKLGGAGDILYSIDRLEIDRRLFLDYHVIPGLYLLNGCMASSGSIIKWFQGTFAPELDFAQLDDAAADIPPGSGGLILLPYFLGEKTPIFDPLARGVFFGATLQHTRAHYYRAILEGISYGFAHHLEIFAERGLPLNRVRVSNGGAHSRLWRQITADVTGLELEEIADHPGSSLGAAFIAGMSVGAFNGWQDIEKYIRVKSTTSPDPAKHTAYRKRFGLYRKIYLANRENFQYLAQIEDQEN